ncbi:hypothetical protein FOC1_g10007145 [Fusarium oxysporum f. sp. cubense race 1]|uniref:SET domain-containing protein n=1 Tax=Fusarium oxysporum f. sp. cubense (strain race 1) TaxID=1229664 RepID=N4U7I3_FUSC1|nr:hypothetical protein FOC1_g10007145 [Fusarium oxysporum f. sp. cubense race 1]
MEDGSEDGHVALIKELEAAMSKEAARKGQLVTDHPDPEALVEAPRKESTKRNVTAEKASFSVTQIPDLYEPCVIPEDDLEPMPISDMRLKTHHRGKKVLLRVKTAPARVTAVVTIVEDEEGTAVLLALYQQLQEDLLTVRHPAQDSVAILKDPFFEQTAEGTYSLQVVHPSDIIWLEDHDERIPEQWRVHRKIKSSAKYRAEGEGLASKEHWLPALHSLKEQNDGAYAVVNMLIDAQEAPPLIDCATFSSLVEIRVAPGRVMGLFLTKDVSAGDLILCGKAFSYYFMDDEKSHETYPILLNMSSKELTSGGSVHLWPQVTQKLFHNPEYIYTIQELFHGDHKKLQIIECDGSPVVDSFMVERIIHYNEVNAPRTKSNDLETRVFRKTGDSLETDNNNTNCVSNCRRSFIGDMQIIRATQDMSAGTKLLLSYRIPCAFESYAQVQKHLSTWGFKCACDLCKSRSKEDKAALEKRRKFCHEASDLLKTEVLQFNFAKARTVLKQLEKTYNGKSANKVRLELSELYFGMSDRYTDSGMHADFVRMIVKSLESLGFVIVAYVPGQLCHLSVSQSV